LENPIIFADRESAAASLALSLHRYKGRDPLILAIPHGALPMGHVLAGLLDGELDVVLEQKIGAPFNPEYAVGAIDETGWCYMDVQLANDTRDVVDGIKARQLAVLQHRRVLYAPYLRPVNPRGRIVIVVDEGAATGATMIAALQAVRGKHPAELVCALPVASQHSIDKIGGYADTVVCLQTPPCFRAVGEFYRRFEQIDDGEVERILSRRRAGSRSLRR
jgi:predicted phosphoribosyltransferase